MGSSQIVYDLRTKQGLEQMKDELKLRNLREVVDYVIQKELKKRGIV